MNEEHILEQLGPLHTSLERRWRGDSKRHPRRSGCFRCAIPCQNRSRFLSCGTSSPCSHSSSRERTWTILTSAPVGYLSVLHFNVLFVLIFACRIFVFPECKHALHTPAAPFNAELGSLRYYYESRHDPYLRLLIPSATSLRFPP